MNFYRIFLWTLNKDLIIYEYNPQMCTFGFLLFKFASYNICICWRITHIYKNHLLGGSLKADLIFIIYIRTPSKIYLVIQKESVYDGFYDSSMKVEDRSSVQNKVKKEGLSPQWWHNCHFDLSIEGRSATSYNILGYFMAIGLCIRC